MLNLESATAAVGLLRNVKVGAKCVVRGIDASAHPLVARRLIDLGFSPGAQVEVVRKAPMGDPVIYRLGGFEIALRGAQTKLIEVEPRP